MCLLANIFPTRVRRVDTIVLHVKMAKFQNTRISQVLGPLFSSRKSQESNQVTSWSQNLELIPNRKKKYFQRILLILHGAFSGSKTFWNPHNAKKLINSIVCFWARVESSNSRSRWDAPPGRGRGDKASTRADSDELGQRISVRFECPQDCYN